MVQQPEADALFKVLVETIQAEDVSREVVVQGQLEANRLLDLRAETEGQVVELLVRKGQWVEAGQPLLRLASDERPARIAGARADLEQQRLNLSGARRLFERKLQSETQMKLAEAAVAAAEANLEIAELDLKRTLIKAPFAGVLEQVPVELGSLVERGDVVVQLIDNSNLKAVGYVPQQSAAQIEAGQQVSLQLLDGRKASATITFVSRSADTDTRSFRVEALLDQQMPDYNAGLSAELRITVGQTRAHFVSASVLALDTNGQVGIKSVQPDGIVSFHPVSLVRTEATGVWVGGLPETIQVIARGQGFVSSGQTVEAVFKS